MKDWAACLTYWAVAEESLIEMADWQAEWQGEWCRHSGSRLLGPFRASCCHSNRGSRGCSLRRWDKETA